MCGTNANLQSIFCYSLHDNLLWSAKCDWVEENSIDLRRHRIWNFILTYELWCFILKWESFNNIIYYLVNLIILFLSFESHCTINYYVNKHLYYGQLTKLPIISNNKEYYNPVMLFYNFSGVKWDHYDHFPILAPTVYSFHNWFIILCLCFVKIEIYL